MYIFFLPQIPSFPKFLKDYKEIPYVINIKPNHGKKVKKKKNIWVNG